MTSPKYDPDKLKKALDKFGSLNAAIEALESKKTDLQVHNEQLKQKRTVNSIENSNILRGCKFYSEIIQDNISSRTAYLHKFLDFAQDADILFFDPDNGMEVKSIPVGRRNSSKYLYFSEVQKAYSAGHSLLIYQHLPPRPRKPLIRDLVNKFKAVTGVNQVHLYWTQFVVFFLIPRQAHQKLFIQASDTISEVWKKQFEICVIT